MKTDQVLDLALPVKALLVPYGVTGAQVDALDSLNQLWPSLEPIGRQEEGVNKAAGEDVDRYMPKVTELLTKTLDGYLKVVQYNNPNVYSQYQTARMIDDSGGNSGTEGYDIQNYVIPPGGSVIFEIEDSPIPADMELYIRVVSTGGGITICTTNLPASPCTAGYTLTAGTTFKNQISAIGLNLSLSNLQFTNPGLTEVIVRAGAKNE